MNRNRSVGHDAAFLVPVPLYFGYGTGCVATTGHVVGGGGGVGGCATAVGLFHYRDLGLLLNLLLSFGRALVVVELVVSLNVAECWVISNQFFI